MLPVTQNNIIKLDLDKECLTKSEEKYTKLLKEQIYWLNRNDDKLYGRSKNFMINTSMEHLTKILQKDVVISNY